MKIAPSTLEDLQLSSNWRHIMVYGPPKCGKTGLVGQLAQWYRLHWLDLEQGFKTLLNPQIVQPAWRKNITVYNIPDTVMVPMAAETLTKVVVGQPVARNVCVKHGKVSCPLCQKDPDALWYPPLNLSTFTAQDILVIDSLTQASQSYLNFIMQKELTAAGDEGYVKPGWDEYAKQGSALTKLLTRIQNAPFHVICISHESLVKMEVETVKKIVPVAGTDNFSRQCARFFDDVVYTEIVNGKFKAISSPLANSQVVAGSRSGKAVELGADKEGLRVLFT